MRQWYWFVVVMGCLAYATPVLADANPDLQKVIEEIRSLRQGQKAIQKRLQEIRTLVGRMAVAAQPRPPVQTVNYVMDVADAPHQGASDAKVALIEFTDFQCPFCGRYFRTTLPMLEKEYVKKSKLRFVLRDFPIPSLHPFAFKAGEAAHCAGAQGKYWQMHDRLFANQQQLAPADLTRYAQALQLDMKRFTDCLRSDRYAPTIRKSIAEGEKDGVTGTPTFFAGFTETSTSKVRIVKQIQGAYPFVVFKQVIDRLLADVAKANTNHTGKRD